MGIGNFWKHLTTSSPTPQRPRIPSVGAVTNLQRYLAASSQEEHTQPPMDKGKDKKEKKDRKEERDETKQKLFEKKDTLTMKQTSIQGKDRQKNNKEGSAGNHLMPAQRMMNNGKKVAPFEASGRLPSIPRPTCPPPTMTASIPCPTQPPPLYSGHSEPEPTRRERLGSITSRFPQFWRGIEEHLQSQQARRRPINPITRLPGCEDLGYGAPLEPLWETRDSNNEKFSFPYMDGSLKDVLASEKKKKEEKRRGKK
ncbi:hypothetical protein B9Z55_025145 [Caenorhabditis nigoni]|uniref:Uncharacterized protein n=1 Tax=Caenorhabditis nigoni TaxID=1611254 RepID=A0A2G5SXM0_9PELO|nr:hypothetical protein B9Z55_025145 [Caenorhabditis nigoni]